MPDGGFLSGVQENAVEVQPIEPRTEEAPEVLVAEDVSPPVVESPSPVVEAPLAPVELSSVEADQIAEEALMEQPVDTFLEDPLPTDTLEQAGATASSTTAVTDVAASVKPVKDEVVRQVEKILEEGLGEYYGEMPEAAKKRFHERGEQVAFEIANMVRQFKLHVKRALKLIRDWLQTIPGVNKFFLEQESKIKTDRLTELEKERHEEANKLP